WLLERLFIEEADRLQPELRVFEEAPGREAADAAGTDDQGRLRSVALPSRLDLRPVEGDPACAEVDSTEGRETDGLGGEVVDVARHEEPQGQNAHRGKACRGHDRPHVVERVEPDVP